MPIRVISFDLDNTLWPILPVIQQAEIILHAWFKQHYPLIPARYSIDDLRAQRAQLMETHPELNKDYLLLRRYALTLLAQEFNYGADLIEAAQAVFQQARHQVELYQDVLPVLHTLQQRYVLCSLTNGTADVDKTCLNGFFQYSIAVHQVGHPKPHPAMFEKLCADAAVEPEEVVHIGDDAVCDVDGAINSGMRGVWLNRHYTHWNGKQRPHATVQNLWAFLQVLEQWQ